MINEQQAHKFCKDDITKIENYDRASADTTQTWHLHHRTEIWWNCSKKELIENECYYHRKACELIFLTNSEHIRLHMSTNNPMKGKHFTIEHSQKMSESLKGRPGPWKGKTLSAETKAKMREAALRREAKKREKDL